MYQPQRYKNDDPFFIYNFIKQYPFATIVMQGKHLMATHVPVLVEGTAKKFRLYAHIANHNSMRELLRSNTEMLLIFTVPNAYISSSWYEKPDIPTWDYSAVHINAEVEIQTAQELERSLESLLQHFEKNQVNSVTREKIPSEMWNENFEEITGFWLHPIKCLGIRKLHQGFNSKDVENITSNLVVQSACPMHQMSDIIKKEHEE